MAEDGRSLSSSSSFGVSLPQWMKTKLNNNDKSFLDHNTFSPPQTDDNFLHLSRFKRNQDTDQKDYPNLSNISTHIESKFDDKAFKLKSKGIDDGFKDDLTSCTSSVLKAAHQMVNASNQKIPLQNVLEQVEEPATEPLNFNRNLRRGSKSLPSSPLSSPKSQRKVRNSNRYFGTSTMESGWILGGLLKKGKLSQSVSVINEEDGGNEAKSGLKLKSASQLSVDNLDEKINERRKIMREMNFYSPTSM